MAKTVPAVMLDPALGLTLFQYAMQTLMHIIVPKDGRLAK